MRNFLIYLLIFFFVYPPCYFFLFVWMCLYFLHVFESHVSKDQHVCSLPLHLPTVTWEPMRSTVSIWLYASIEEVIRIYIWFSQTRRPSLSAVWGDVVREWNSAGNMEIQVPCIARPGEWAALDWLLRCNCGERLGKEPWARTAQPFFCWRLWKGKVGDSDSEFIL